MRNTILLPLLLLAAAPVGRLHAQAAAVPSSAPDSIVQLEADSLGLAPVPLDRLPMRGTFWVITADCITAPLPFLPPSDLGAPVYDITNDIFLVDATAGQVDMQSLGATSTADALNLLASQVEKIISQTQTASSSQQKKALSAGTMMVAADSISRTLGDEMLIDTNGLWLRITGVSNGIASLVLNNATDDVYEVMSKTDLKATNWTVEPGALFPTNSSAMPFTVPVLDGMNALFIQVGDWTGITENGNSVPDWWFWVHFGALGFSDSDLDSQGSNTLLYDYTNGLDPNIVTFNVRLGNRNFNTTTPAGYYSILAGAPSYEAVLINDSNLEHAEWQPYDGTIHMYLGPTDGVYQVWMGLKGRAADSQPTWVGTTVTLTRTAPQITVTSPATNVVAQPWLQVKGYSTRPLDRVSYDFDGMTNLQGSIIARTLDANLFAYTTNYFQCYDIPLTNGLNTITLHATDPAGNTTTTNITVALDYSTATNPAIQLTWPRNGVDICGTSFTVRGWTEDSSSSVEAQISGTNGDTNVLIGMVERTGVLWVKNLPLWEGTNWVTLCVTNAAGLSSETNFFVVKSDMTLTLTNIKGDLWLPTVEVSGLISDPNAPIWVNGVQGTNYGNGTWSAYHVPISSSGVASFDMSTIPPGGSDPIASTNVDKPDELVMASAKWRSTIQAWNYADPNAGLHIMQASWNRQSGGTIHYHDESQDSNLVTIASSDETDTLAPDCSITKKSVQGDDATGPYWSEANYFYDNLGRPIGVHFASDEGEFDVTNFDLGGVTVALREGEANRPPHNEYLQDKENSDVDMEYELGGPAKAGSQVIVSGTATATELYPISTNVPYDQITDGQIGQLGSDGYAYAEAANGSSVQVTPRANVPFHSFTTSPSPYRLNHFVFACSLPIDRTIVGIGEVVQLNGMPSSTQWSVSGGGTVSPTNGTQTTFTAAKSPGSATIHAKIRGTDQTAAFSVVAPSSINVIDSSNSPPAMENPNGTITGARTYYSIFLGPTNVSFANVLFREKISPEVITWPSGLVVTNLAKGTTNAILLPSCGGTAQDKIEVYPIPISWIYNGTNYVDFSWGSSWADQYQDDSGNWVDFKTMKAAYEFRGSDKKARVTYLGVPGGWQGPY